MSTFSVGGTPQNLLAAFGSLWVGTAEGRVFRVDPAPISSKTTGRFPMPVRKAPSCVRPGRGLAHGGAGRGLGRQLQDDLAYRSGHFADRTAAKRELWGPMAYGFGSLWVLGPELERLSPATMRRVATVDLPGGSTDIATGLGADRRRE